MKTALVAVFQKKSTWIAFIGIVTSLFGAWLAKHGFDTSGEHTDKVAECIASFFALVLLQQASADHGKEKAKIEQQNIQIDPPNQAGFMRLDTVVMVLLLGAGIALLATACGAFKGEAKHAAGDAIDCASPKLLDRSTELASVLERSIPAVLSDTGKVDRAGFKSLTAGLVSDAAGCAIATAIKRLSAPRGQDSLSSPLAVDAADLQSAWSDVDRDQFSGRTFAVAP